MKKLVLVLALMMVCCLCSTYLYAEENQPTKKYSYVFFSIGGGGFFPGGDLDNFDSGFNGTLSGGMTLGKFMGMGIDVSYRQNEEKKQYNYDTNKLSTFGMDYLFYLQPNDWRVQPYVAAGFGLYYNHLNNWKGIELSEDSGFGYGVVAKAGIRFFITDNLFLGAYGKYFTDWQELKVRYFGPYYYFEENKTLNFGGLVGNIELGFKF